MQRYVVRKHSTHGKFTYYILDGSFDYTWLEI